MANDLHATRPDETLAASGTASGAASGKRNEARDILVITASMRLGRERIARDVTVRNISANGLMIERNSLAEIGTPVWLHLDGAGDVTGKLAWCTEGRMGIALDTAIDPDEIKAVIDQRAR